MSAKDRFQEESAYLDFVHLNIDLRKKEIADLIENPGGATPASGYHVRRMMQSKELPDPRSPYFTRVDLENGQTIYYGFAMLTKANSSPEVPASHPGITNWLTYHIDMDSKGYRALPLEDLPDVIRRVRIVIKNGELVELVGEETRQLDPSPLRPKEEVLASELLTATMTETRGESLSAVGSTLQPDQFKISRAPNDTILVVQGPPGSGKTVVLLERLSRIAFKDPLAREKGLVLIGPNQKFLEYVEQALATLGKSDVITSTVEDLTKYKYELTRDHDSIEILKAKSLMESIIDELILDAPRVLESNYVFEMSGIKVEFTVMESYELIANYRDDQACYELIKQKASNTALNALTEKFFLIWEDQGRDRSRFDGDPKIAIQQTSTFKTMMRNMFPDLTPENCLKKLKKSSNEFIKYAARNMELEDIEDWLTHVIPEPFEIRISDIPLLDYLDFRIKGRSGAPWGHIAIDEAQNLTPMQLRMLARRVDHPSALSLTGDLAQAIGAIYYEDWNDIAQYFNSDNVFKTELTRSYRVPTDVIEYSLRFLEKTGVQVSAAEPFLDVESALNLLVTPRESFTSEAEKLALEYLSAQESVLIIGSSEIREKMAKWNPKTEGSAHFKIYAPTDVKGLEFDVVIIVDPVGILMELNFEVGRSARLMYVNVTRSTKKLFVLGPSMEQISDPVEYFGRLDEEYYESRVEELLGDMSDYAEKDDIGNPANGVGFLHNAYSVPSLCSQFGLNVSTINPKFHEGVWRYLGSTQSRCLECGSKPQLFFGEEMEAGNYFATVCLNCEVIRGDTDYEKQIIEEILAELSPKSEKESNE